MYCSGAIAKLGRVDRKDSFLDNFSVERDRGITIFSKQAVFNYNNTQFTLLDTPGHVDFSAEAERTLQVLDYAVLVISGTDGVQSHTQTLWRLLAKYKLPCFIFVNKMDLNGADRQNILSSLSSLLGDGCVDFTNAGERSFFENIALCDDALLNKYYETDTVETADITAAIQSRRIFPCLFGSALKLDGVKELLACLDTFTVMPRYGEKFGAKVYKIAEDNRQNRLTFLKITGGTLRVRDTLESDKNINGEKITQIRIYSGEKFTPVSEARAGTVCAVTGVTFTSSGDGLGAEKNTAMPVLEPVLTYRVNLPDGVDVKTALSKLKILEKEDPQLNVVWNERLNEIQMRLMGEIQLEVLSRIIADRFGFSVTFGKGNIIYKETIQNKVEGVGHFEPLRHYAEVHLILKPAERGAGLIVKNECSEDMLDKNRQRLILTHLCEKEHIGVLTGSPITDMEISLVSGRAHPKHTEGGDFRQATYRAVRQGLRRAQSVLLEPVYEFRLEVPPENVGRAMTDIGRISSDFNPPQAGKETAVITGTAPVALMDGYAKDVMQYTHGRGRLVCTLKGYEPCHNTDEVIARVGYDCEADIQNPCDSVFCSHGAGHTVKWNEVQKHMHLPAVLCAPNETTEGAPEKDLSKFKNADDIFAVDKELMRIFEQTYGPVKKRADSAKTKIKKPAQSTDAVIRKKHISPEYDGEEYILVDGYNVIFSWENLKKLSDGSIDGARAALINILCNYQGFCKCELILVFDAYRVKGRHREVERVNGISVVYTKEAETADMYIEKASYKLAKNHRVRVVTSDAMEQMIILGNGALRVPSLSFLEEVRQAENEIRAIISSKE